jgi:micrococcal nuclease
LLGLIGNAIGGDSGGDGRQGDATEAPQAGDTPGAAISTPSLIVPTIAPGEGEPATVLDIIDGDTIDVRLASGAEERIRYYGIDTPERGDDCYGEASDRNSQLAGQSVLLRPDARERDSSGRLLRYVYRSDGTSIDARLIAEGLATAWEEDGQYRQELIALQAEAEQNNVGCLWEDG